MRVPVVKMLPSFSEITQTRQSVLIQNKKPNGHKLHAVPELNIRRELVINTIKTLNHTESLQKFIVPLEHVFYLTF